MDIVEFQTIFDVPVRNGIYKSKEFQGRGVRLVKMNQLFSERRLHSQADGYELIELTEKERQTLLLKKNDLLFSRTSVVADGVGKCSIIAEVNQELTWDSNIIRVRLNPDKAYPQFYFYFFNSTDGREVVKRLSSGAAVTTITGSGLTASHVPLPPLPTQRRIAGILSAYDELIENNQRRIRILEDMARSLYREWFVHFRYPGHESVPLANSPLGQIPQGWEVKRLFDLAKVAYGKNLPTKNLLEDGAYPVYGAAKIIGRYNEFTREHRTIICGCRGSVGEMQITRAPCFVTNNSFTFDPSHTVSFFWLYLTLAMRGLRDVVGGAAQPQITLEGISSVELATPPLQLRAHFQNAVSPMFQQVWLLGTQTENLRSTRDLLLPRLLSGQVALDAMEPNQAIGSSCRT